MRVMKRLAMSLLALTLGFTLLLPCLAAESADGSQSAVSSTESLPYDTSRWRYSDATGTVPKEDKARLDNRALDAVKQYHFDFVVGIIDDNRKEGMSTEDYCSRVYHQSGYGYGKEQAGVCLFAILDEKLQPKEYYVGSYGSKGEVYFPREKREALAAAFQQTVESAPTPADGYTPAAEAFFNEAFRQVKLAQATEQAQNLVDRTMPTVKDTEAEEREMPSWYPENWGDFQYFYDPNAPQLTDTADIFTDEEEVVIREKLKALRDTYGSDFVVFTDVSTYGLSRKVYAADFFEATGHGLGEDYAGMVLFICMEEGNRGWWTAAKGSVRPLFTEATINRMDNLLEPYMKGGSYGAGVINYLDNLDILYRTGKPPVPFTTYLIALGGALVAGIAVGALVMFTLQGKMKTVKEAAHADSYLVKGSFDLRHSRDIFLYSTVSRTKRESDSGGSGGGSSYSGSYSSSSGSDWSGGGRSF